LPFGRRCGTVHSPPSSLTHREELGTPNIKASLLIHDAIAIRQTWCSNPAG
jgi:hypothetical protein